MGAVSKGNITFAKKTNKESLSCEFINMCYHIVLLTQIERYNWISEDSDNGKITLDIPPIKKAQFGYQADHKEVRTSTAKCWKSLDFQRFSFCPTRQNTAVFGTWAWVIRESHASWGKWLTIAKSGSEPPANERFAPLCRLNRRGCGFMAPPFGPTFGGVSQHS